MTPEQREAKRARWRRWYEAHKEQVAEIHRGYIAKNREKVNAATRAWRARQKGAKKLDAKPVQAEMFPSKKKPDECTCGDVHNCIRCRTAERKRRAQAKDTANVLKPLMDAMSPDVLAACLEVRALNTSKRQSVQTPVMAGD